MSDKKPSKSKLSSADADLWKEMTKDVQRFEDRDYVEGEDKPELEQPEESEFEALVNETAPEPSVQKERQKPVTGQGLDRVTEEKLRKGEMRIDARIDLHGMTQDKARVLLVEFIEASYQQQKRCVLVITGKGKGGDAQDRPWYEPEPGILKRRTPEWLSEAAMKPYVLKFVQAQRKDGGEGALYVFLRRHR